MEAKPIRRNDASAGVIGQWEVYEPVEMEEEQA
jgi:hypothetical protein